MYVFLFPAGPPAPLESLLAVLADDWVQRQLGTATYMLDVLALRVGNEKDNSEEADTVGCCSLRVEHITFNVRVVSSELLCNFNQKVIARDLAEK